MSDQQSSPISDELLKFAQSKSDVLDAGDVAVVEQLAQSIRSLEERIDALDEGVDERAVEAVNRAMREAQRRERLYTSGLR